MFNKQKFTVTEKPLKLMRRMNVSYGNYCEFGAPEIDPKHPYLNLDPMEQIGLGLSQEAAEAIRDYKAV